jgi:hypothetical protein
MTFGGAAASFLVPSLGIYFRGQKIGGLAALTGWGLLLLLFLAGFGSSIGDFAFGLSLAVHASGFTYYCNPLLRQAEFRTRAGFVLLALLALGMLFYLPARHAVLQRWLMPLHLNGRVFVVQRHYPAVAIRRGDWIAYKLGNGSSSWDRGGGHGTIYMRSGMGLGPVLAMAGDRVVFSTNAFTVNGVARPLRPHMPQSGEVTLREKQWFVWPELGISGYGNTPEDTISATMLPLALVSENDFVGKPFQRWLWRQQIAP